MLRAAIITEVIKDHQDVAPIPCHTVRPSLEIALAMYKSDKLGRPAELPLADEDACW